THTTKPSLFALKTGEEFFVRAEICGLTFALEEPVAASPAIAIATVRPRPNKSLACLHPARRSTPCASIISSHQRLFAQRSGELPPSRRCICHRTLPPPCGRD